MYVLPVHVNGRSTEAQGRPAPVSDALEAIERVRNLHRQGPIQRNGLTYCTHCEDMHEYAPVKYPCPTIKALDGSQ